METAFGINKICSEKNYEILIMFQERFKVGFYMEVGFRITKF